MPTVIQQVCVLSPDKRSGPEKLGLAFTRPLSVNVKPPFQLSAGTLTLLLLSFLHTNVCFLLYHKHLQIFKPSVNVSLCVFQFLKLFTSEQKYMIGSISLVSNSVMSVVFHCLKQKKTNIYFFVLIFSFFHFVTIFSQDEQNARSLLLVIFSGYILEVA